MVGELILIVDDNALNRKLARVTLEAEGYLVRTAVDAEDARKFLAHVKPRLILMDFQMPGQDGVALTRELKADPRTRGILILIVTSYELKGEEEQARAAGCDAYITKPIDTLELPQIIGRYLRETPALGAGPAPEARTEGPQGEGK